MFAVDPFARVAFLNYSQATEKISRTLCPTWDQTLLFDIIDIYGDPQDVALKPPQIVLEIFDHDPFVCLAVSFSLLTTFFTIKRHTVHSKLSCKLNLCR